MESPAESRGRPSWRARLASGPGLVVLGLALVLGGAALLRWFEPSAAKHADKLSPSRDLAPIHAAVLPDLTGQPQPIKQWAGRVLVVNFWATWCGPCREEIPELIDLHAQFAREPVTIVGLAIDQSDPVREYAKEMGITYPVLIGGFGALDLARAAGNTYGVLPFTVVIDRRGEIADAHLGRISAARLDAIVRKAL